MRDAASHAPIPNAFVVVSAGTLRKATASDSQGRFALDGLAPAHEESLEIEDDKITSLEYLPPPKIPKPEAAPQAG